jgi:hypothetical protein
MWGDDWFFQKNSQGELKKNYFVAEVEKSARYAVPFVKNLKNMLTNVPPRGYNTEKLDRGNGLSVLQSRAAKGVFTALTLAGTGHFIRKHKDDLPKFNGYSML